MTFSTSHHIHLKNSASLKPVGSQTIDLIVTSPPYPMIEMWDESFCRINSKIAEAFEKGQGIEAFELMHKELDKTWVEVVRVLKPGGIVCINIGDATRTIKDVFSMYPNHVRILSKLIQLGLLVLPEILWRKPTNSPTKFLGSGMLAPGAYVTLEHEFILIARKGDKRIFTAPEAKQKRGESAYFWEERNNWFSDVWMGLIGTVQKMKKDDVRKRSGAYPFELAYRLINMFSVYGDTVLDPFLGSGTTTAAAAALGRNSIGFEIETGFQSLIDDQIRPASETARNRLNRRIQEHLIFIENRLKMDLPVKYQSSFYDFPVMTRQEKEIRFQLPKVIHKDETGYSIKHKWLDKTDISLLSHNDSKAPSQLSLVD